MKKIIFAMALAVAANVGCMAADNQLHVKMNIKGMGDTVVVVSQENVNARQNFTGKQGVFEFDIALDSPAYIYIVEPQVLRNQPGRRFQIPAIPDESVLLTAESENRYDIDGSKFYAQYHEADIAIENASKDLNELSERCQHMLDNGVSRDSVANLYRKEFVPLMEKAQNSITDFVKAHPDYEACTAIIGQLQDLDRMKEAVQLLAPAVRDGRCKPLYQVAIDQMEAYAKKEAESAIKQASGVQAPDFELNDINGKPFKFSSLRGKYVILDFWGSWCGWCIKGFPKMKEYYEKYAGKFEILGVDCSDTETKWKAAVKRLELPWLHVYNPEDSQVLADYGITGFPTKIIVGPDGKIIKTITGEDPEFYTVLDELFGK